MGISPRISVIPDTFTQFCNIYTKEYYIRTMTVESTKSFGQKQSIQVNQMLIYCNTCSVRWIETEKKSGKTITSEEMKTELNKTLKWK